MKETLNFEIRKHLEQMEGGAGCRTSDDFELIKLKLAAGMYHVGKSLYNYIKAGLDPIRDDPEAIEAIKDIDALIAEILIYEYKK